MRRNLEVATFLLFAFILAGLVVSLFAIEAPEDRRFVWPCMVGATMGLITFTGFLTWGKKSSDPNAPTVVASLPDEMSASALVVKLASHGLKARAVGGFTSGFQTEVASDVRVVVPASQFAAAVNIINS